MATANILVVDSDQGFGNILKEGLTGSGQYTAKCVNTGSDALQSVIEEPFDLIVIDMGLADMPPATLIQAVREAKNSMRVMIMTFMGEALPKEIKELNVNGTLTKPFFVGDLPDLIGQALGVRAAAGPRPVAAPPAPPPLAKAAVPPPPKNDPAPTRAPGVAKAEPAPLAPQDAPPAQAGPSHLVLTPIPPLPQETIRFLRANETEIVRLLDDLNREVRAEAILLIAGPELIAQAGMLSRAQCYELTLLISQSAQAAAQAARFLGERAGRFGQSLHEGSEVRLYSLSLAEGISLSLALNSNVPLGMIRHQCRQTADRLGKYII